MVKTNHHAHMAAAVFLVCALGSLSIVAGSLQETEDPQDKKTGPVSEWAKQWLDEVVPCIITGNEKEYFEKLQTEEQRGLFVQKFWDIRDPNPETPENEFKIEHYRRIALADKYFSHSGLKGRRTERGKMFILLGPPDEIRTDSKHYGASMARKETARAGLSRYQEDPFMYGTHSGKEIWVYWNPPNRRLPPDIEFVFVDKLGSGNYVLENTVKLGEAGKSDAAYNIDSLKDVFDTIAYDAVALQNPFEEREDIKGTVTTQVTYERIPASLDLYQFKGSSGRTLTPFTIELPYSDITYNVQDKNYLFSLTLVVTVKKGDGQIVYEQSLDTNFKLTRKEFESKKAEMCRIQAAVSFEPGNYILDTSVIDNLSGKIGHLPKVISIPDRSGENLSMSDIFLTLGTGEEKSFEDSILQRVASVRKTFHPGDELNISFEVYNLAQSAEGEISEFAVEYTFLQGDKIMASVPIAPQSLTNTRDQEMNTSLKLKNFRPGTYKLQARVHDLVSGESIIQEAFFQIAQ